MASRPATIDTKGGKKLVEMRSRSETNLNTFMSGRQGLKCLQLEDQPYYHGYLTRHMVEKMLENAGDFVVRLNTENHVEYILSVRSDSRQLFHSIIGQRDNGDWTLGDLSSKSPVILVNNYVKTQKILEEERTGDLVRLRHPIGRASWEITHEQIYLGDGRVIGRGMFGQVIQAMLRRDDGSKNDVAVKVAESRLKRETIEEVMNEVVVMKTLRHENVVQFYGVAAEREPVMLVMELVGGGALDVKLREKNLDLVTKWKLSLDAARGLRHLHESRIVHRDIAARNCLITTTGKLKIADFGMSQKLKTGEKSYENIKDCPLPIKWMPPEALRSQKFTFESDVWSYGVLLWEIASDGLEPYGEATASDTVELIMAGHLLEAPTTASANLRDLMYDCWRIKWRQRPRFSDICRTLEHLSLQGWPD